MKKVNEGLLRYNAERCEAAKSRYCRCVCGGKFHGKEHSEDWIQEILEEGPPEKPGDKMDLRIK